MEIDLLCYMKFVTCIAYMGCACLHADSFLDQTGAIDSYLTELTIIKILMAARGYHSKVKTI